MRGIKRVLWMWRLRRWEKLASAIFLCDRDTAHRIWDVVENSPTTLCDIAVIAEIYGALACHGYKANTFAKMATSLLDGDHE